MSNLMLCLIWNKRDCQRSKRKTPLTTATTTTQNQTEIKTHKWFQSNAVLFKRNTIAHTSARHLGKIHTTPKRISYGSFSSLFTYKTIASVVVSMSVKSSFVGNVHLVYRVNRHTPPGEREAALLWTALSLILTPIPRGCDSLVLADGLGQVAYVLLVEHSVNREGHIRATHPSSNYKI